ncbi:MAG: hypothetical protein JRI68_12740 [Deltaproteobacteria bacterium]|nr:hypothetical protein [Deltaproteobacteria bacterium]
MRKSGAPAPPSPWDSVEFDPLEFQFEFQFDFQFESGRVRVRAQVEKSLRFRWGEEWAQTLGRGSATMVP